MFLNSESYFVITVDGKSSVEQVLGRPDHGTDHGQRSAAVLVLLVGFAQQLRLKVPVVLAPSGETQRGNRVDDGTQEKLSGMSKR